MDLGVNKYLFFLGTIFFSLSLKGNDSNQDTCSVLQMNELKVLIKENQREQNASLRKQEELEHEIVAARRIIELLNNDIELVEEERLDFEDEIRVAKEEIINTKTRCKQAIVQDYMYNAGKRNFAVLFFKKSRGFYDLFKKLKYLKLVSDLRLRQIKRLKSKLVELEALKVVYEGTQLEKDLLNNKRVDVIVNLNGSLRKLYESNATVKDRIDSLRLELLTRKPRTSKKLESSKYFLFPVTHGVVTKSYGKYRHPTERKIQLNNTGISVLSYEGADVFAPAACTVKSIFEEGYDRETIVLSYENYLFVFGNVISSGLVVGNQVGKGQAIGKVALNDKGKPMLHLETWLNGERLNPEQVYH